MSFRKYATQSHTAAGLYEASYAVDRDIATCMRTEPIGQTSPYQTVWWKVDLGGVYNIYSVKIMFKNYDGFGKKQQISFFFLFYQAACKIFAELFIINYQHDHLI